MQHLDDGRLQAWLDGAKAGLDAGERAAIEHHLAACADCAARLDELAGLDEAAKSILGGGGTDAVTPPPFEDVVARAGRLEQTRSTYRRLRPFAWAASVVLALGIGWGVNELSEPVSQTAPAGAEFGPQRGAAAASEEARAAESEALGARDESQAPAPTDADDLASDALVAADVVTEAEPTADVVGRESAAFADRARESSVARREMAGVAPDSLRTLAGLADPAVANLTTDPDLIARATDPATVAPPATAEPREQTEKVARVDAVLTETLAEPAMPGVVRGLVRTEEGQPLQGAQVVLAGTSVGALTNGNGEFALYLDSTDAIDSVASRSLVVQLLGYGAEEVEIGRLDRLGAGHRIDVRMSAQALALDQVVVTGAPVGDTGAAAASRQGFVAPLPQTRAARRLPTLELDLDGVAWVTVAPDRAAAVAGVSVTPVPGGELVRTQIGNVGGRPVVRATHRLGAVTLTALYAAFPMRLADGSTPAGHATVSGPLGDDFVLVTGPLAGSELEALVDAMREGGLKP